MKKLLIILLLFGCQSPDPCTEYVDLLDDYKVELKRVYEHRRRMDSINVALEYLNKNNEDVLNDIDSLNQILNSL